MMGFGHHATDFTDDVGQLSEFAQVCLPGVELLLFDVWLPQVIQDKGCIRAEAHQFDDARQLPVLDAEIERKVILPHQAHSGDKIKLQAEVWRRLVLEVAPDSFDEGRDGYQGFQVPANSKTALDRSSSNDGLQTRLIPCQVRDVARLTQRLLRLNAYLDVDHPYNGEALRLLAIVLQAIGPV